MCGTQCRQYKGDGDGHYVRTPYRSPPSEECAQGSAVGLRAVCGRTTKAGQRPGNTASVMNE